MRLKLILPVIVCFVIAVVIFVFAEGYRRLYSGGFFALLGVVLMANAGCCKVSSKKEVSAEDQKEEKE
jgi:hypothetical protein